MTQKNLLDLGIGKIIDFNEINLAQSRFSTYNAKEFNLGINLTYKYTITNMGKNLWNKFINKRDLVKVELFSV